MNINPQFFKDIILETQDNQSRLSISSNDIYDIENKDLDRRIKNVGLNEISTDLNKLNIQNEALNIGSTRAFIAYDQFDIPINIESPIFLTNSQNNKIDMRLSPDGTPWILKNMNQANSSSEMTFEALLTLSFEQSKKRIEQINDELESKYINKEFTISDGNSLYSLLGISVLSVSDIISGYNLIGLENGDISVTGYTAVEAIYQNLLNTKSLIEELKTIDQSEEYYKFQIDRIRSITDKTDLDELILTLDKYLEDLSKITASYNQLIEERSRLVSMLYDKKMYDLVKPFEMVINNEDFEKYSSLQTEEDYIVLSEDELKEYYEYKEKYPYMSDDDTIKNGNQVHVSFFETLTVNRETLYINPPLLFKLYDLYFRESNQSDLKYLTDSQKSIYYYHYNKNGTSSASSYLNALKDNINKEKGYEGFSRYRDFMLSDSGEVVKFLNSFLKGNLDGFEASIEGFVSAFYSDGRKSANQYEQMYILEFLATNFTEEGLEQHKKLLEENKISQQDFNNYKQIYEKVTASNDVQWLRTIFHKGAYQVGSGIGYMAPSIGLNLAIPGLGTGYLFVSSYGNKLEQSHQTYGTLTSDAYAYSFMSSLASTALESLGGLPGFADESAGILRNLFNEAWTEFVQEYVDSGFDSLHYNQKYDIKDVTLSAIEQAIFGFITAGVLRGGTSLANSVPMIINVAGQDVKLNFQQLLKVYEAYKIPDIDLRQEALMDLATPIGITFNLFGRKTTSNIKSIEAYINGESRHKSFKKYLSDLGIKFSNPKDNISSAKSIGDAKLYMFGLIRSMGNYPDPNFQKYLNIVPGDIDSKQMFKDLQQYFTLEQKKTIKKLMSSGYIENQKYTELQKSAVFNYTACGGFEINGWLNNIPQYRSYYKDIDFIQNRVSGKDLGNGRKNRNFSTSDGSILTELDSVISSARYDEAIITYRGLKDLYDGSLKIEPHHLKVGDTFSSSGYQSSSLIFEKNFGYRSNNVNIILEIITLPNSGTGAFIENISGVTNYGQAEFLIKRNATMTVVGNVYKTIVNGMEKIIVPVVVQ